MRDDSDEGVGRISQTRELAYAKTCYLPLPVTKPTEQIPLQPYSRGYSPALTRRPSDGRKIRYPGDKYQPVPHEVWTIEGQTGKKPFTRVLIARP